MQLLRILSNNIIYNIVSNNYLRAGANLVL